MHKRSQITQTIWIILLLVGCQSAAKGGKLVHADLPRIEAPVVGDVALATVRDGNNTFAIDLFHAINHEKTENLIFSPYSIWLAFSMVYGGAQGETESQMVDVFHFLNQDRQHSTLNAIDLRLEAKGDSQTTEGEGTPFQLQLANAVWSQQGYAFKPTYLDLLATQYGAGLRVVDFQRDLEAARQAINTWVADNTDEKIKEIAAPGSISSDTRLVLTNAILFKASWMYPFEHASTANGQFTLLDGSVVTAPLMHVGVFLDYIEKDEYQAVRLPYAGYKTEMWVILPAAGQWEAVQNELGVELMNEILQSSMAHVTLTLPRYDFESELSLNDLLVSMGLMQAFCPQGDYGGISEGRGLCISQAVHKATIKVDEEGTEATAATLVAMPVAIMQEVEMKIDRPFLFEIIDRESGLILFLGQVLNPVIH